MQIRDVVFIALFAAIIAALGVFPPITLPVVAEPITAQSLGVMLAGGVLGAKRGGLAVILFLALVAIGLPLLSDGRGGFGVFLGPTGGYLVGWAIAAFIIGHLTERVLNRLNFVLAFAICFAGAVVVLYAIGVPWSAYVAKIPVSTALAGSAPFGAPDRGGIPGEIVKCLIAAAVIVVVKRSYPIMQTRDVVFIALFAAIIAALGVFPPITLPVIAVPITAQSLGVMLAGGVLGARRGGLALVLFLALVAIGLPLLSGGRGGFGVFLGPTGGYLVGWAIAAFIIGYLTERFWTRLNYVLAFAICFAGAVVVLYAIGIPWSAYVAKIPVSTAFAGSAPFIPGDIVKCLIAAAVIVVVKRSYPIITSKA